MLFKLVQFVDIDLDGELEFVTQIFNSSNQIQVYEILDDELTLVGSVMQSNGSYVISDSVMVPTFADIDSMEIMIFLQEILLALLLCMKI